MVLVTAVGALVGALTPAVRAEPIDASPIDCSGPAPDAEPDTPEWTLRDRQNLYCAWQRVVDAAQHPGGGFMLNPFSRLELDPFDPQPPDLRGAIPYDEYTTPERHDGQRFRYRPVTVTNRDFLNVPVELYRPCAAGTCADMPDALPTYEPPYPVVIVVPGGFQGLGPGAPKEQYRWVAQGLAEAGYMVALHDITSAHLEDAQDVLTWILSDANPVREEADADHIGIAGHSGGGATASRLGQLDDRFDAIVSFDGSTRYPLPEADEDITTPALFFVGDYGVLPTSTYDEPPDPDGTAHRVDERFVRLRDLGVDTMHLALRATSHSDWSPHLGNRYSALVSLYYTQAWFDRYLKGPDHPATADDAFGRLTAAVFDDSADIRYISQGFFDPVQAASSGDPYGGNVPYTIAGMAVANRLSFYFPSRCFIAAPTNDRSGHGFGHRADQGQAVPPQQDSTRVTSDDMRHQGCEP